MMFCEFPQPQQYIYVSLTPVVTILKGVGGRVKKITFCVVMTFLAIYVVHLQVFVLSMLFSSLRKLLFAKRRRVGTSNKHHQSAGEKSKNIVLEHHAVIESCIQVVYI